jgi:diguanylate cyclase (GGDEF)-like protein
MALIRRRLRRLGGNRPDDFQGAVLLMVDLDHFKRVNDRWGHEAGDRTLQRVAEALKNAIREVDLATRWGGDEFVVLARGVERSAVRALVGRLLRQIAATRIQLDGESLEISASIGFVTYPITRAEALPGKEWSVLVDAADRLMYAAKQRGRARGFGVVWPIGSARPGEAEALAELQATDWAPEADARTVEVLASEEATPFESTESGA